MILGQSFAKHVVDIDGVIWRGKEAIAGSPETIRSLREAGREVIFMTNNSGSTPAEVVARLATLGAGDLPVESVVTSAIALQAMLQEEVPALRGRNAFVIGAAGLMEAIEALGVRIADGTDPSEISLVIVGIDKKLTYEKLKRATLAIRAGAAFYATNTDATLPAADGLWPGAGSIVAALRESTGVSPRVAGKPNAPMMAVARDRLDGGPGLVIGDRVDTDVLSAVEAGWPSALVLTGATGLAELAVATAWPDYILRDLASVLRDLPHPKIRPAMGQDLTTIATLLHAGGLQAGAARERVGRTIVAQTDRDTVLATAAWEPVGQSALLRSVATHPDARGLGLGIQVVAGVLRGIADAKIRDVYLITEDAEAFFKTCGFRTVSRDEVPDAVMGHPQVKRECSPSAPIMRMSIPLPR